MTDDADLVDALRRGDVRAFDRVYATYGGRIFTFLLRLSNRREVAEDLAQETWIKLARSAPGLAENTRLAPYLFTIARNAFVSYRRWALLDISRLVALGLEAMEAAPPPDVAHETARELARLEEALVSLPVASREVLLLVGVEGLAQDEVAKMLGLSWEALRQRLHRARKELGERMTMLETGSRQRRAEA